MFYSKNINQRTNGPVNAHLISWPSKAQNKHVLDENILDRLWMQTLIVVAGDLYFVSQNQEFLDGNILDRLWIQTLIVVACDLYFV